MLTSRPKVLVIGGFDPSAGAGVLADIKAIEEHKVYGLAVNTANTIQNDCRFESVNWLDEKLVLGQLDILLDQYDFKYVKIGLIESLGLIHKILDKLPEGTRVIWDPVLSASAGFDFNHDLEAVGELLKRLFLITPNWNEAKKLSGLGGIEGAKLLTKYCKVYLKGGHNTLDLGRDYLLEGAESFTLKNKAEKPSEKHGSGCVFASALAANLTLNYPLMLACAEAKHYIGKFLDGTPELLGYHKM
ncbi:hydroxymethylpyrimidine/phosphomethylpyrimidine kinase [Fulvivirga sp. RKSG066]|uniref:hydroxymethylpyrimidine/phosphomethylpyrimidine kinase n=1 Tax=Fulvivirga aurantia TaxID=2529383 RepID=UPI0012BCABF0|nr:hydroxymethylpyrimidine/phosphomethylpyrimidine kinase [Fulvivirga aurantia]MTI22061.1 hydroxymethylpyrimidine/phosphomethylpyrimidine kinase [Fulvivirga aurantia]